MIGTDQQAAINTLASTILKIVAIVAAVVLVEHPTPGSDGLVAVLIAVIGAQTLETIGAHLAAAYVFGKRADINKASVQAGNGHVPPAGGVS